MARGAVVLIVSDGWERDDPSLLAQQMAALGRHAHDTRCGADPTSLEAAVRAAAVARHVVAVVARLAARDRSVAALHE